MARKELGLALGGGGAAGIAHIGILELLEREQLIPDLIVGSSIGAVIGALYALDPDVERLKQKVEQLLVTESVSRKWKGAVPSENSGGKRIYRELVHFVHRQLAGIKVFTTISLRSAEELIEILTPVFADRQIADMKIPFAAVVLDIVSGRERVVTEGSLVDAVYASAAIPGVFPPKAEGEELLVDGGFTSNCPIQFARRLGADYVIAVQLPASSASGRVYETGIDVLSRTDEIVRRKLADLEAETTDLLIIPETKAIHWADFSNWKSIVQLGFEAAAAKVNDLHRLGKLCHGNPLARFSARLFSRRQN